VAEKYRKEGNNFFNKAQYAQAIDYYTKSIAVNKTAVTLANRAQAYLNIGK
jgi:tetratricopeptide (TPR) repeat protein